MNWNKDFKQSVTTSQDSNQSTKKTANTAIALLTPKEAGRLLKVSDSWLAKARMRGDGPPYAEVGRSIRYTEDELLQWLKSRRRFSTSERDYVRGRKSPRKSDADNNDSVEE